MNSSDKALERSNFLLAFMDSSCPVMELTAEEYDESIQENQDMLYYAIHTGNKEEIAFWRTQVQKAKTEKRQGLRKNKLIKEIATT